MLDPQAKLDAEWSAIRSVTIAEGSHDIHFFPNNPRNAFVLVGGHWHDRTGMSCSSREALTMQRDFFVEAGAQWFMPILERLAAGEQVSLADLEQASARHGVHLRVFRPA